MQCQRVEVAQKVFFSPSPSVVFADVLFVIGWFYQLDAARLNHSKSQALGRFWLKFGDFLPFYRSFSSLNSLFYVENPLKFNLKSSQANG